ncbi:MAG: hypothetical protein EA391_06460 [Balneolaceae bacterium]|nr:MAG: hypothetical protein EA391_06460 [Balneolaceae bacterium]
MNSLHNKIHRFINGSLSPEESEDLQKKIRDKKLWRDYLITEITARQKRLGAENVGEFVDLIFSDHSSQRDQPFC